MRDGFYEIWFWRLALLAVSVWIVSMFVKQACNLDMTQMEVFLWGIGCGP